MQFISRYSLWVYNGQSLLIDCVYTIEAIACTTLQHVKQNNHTATHHAATHHAATYHTATHHTATHHIATTHKTTQPHCTIEAIDCSHAITCSAYMQFMLLIVCVTILCTCRGALRTCSSILIMSCLRVIQLTLLAVCVERRQMTAYMPVHAAGPCVHAIHVILHVCT